MRDRRVPCPGLVVLCIRVILGHGGGMFDDVVGAFCCDEVNAAGFDGA